MLNRGLLGGSGVGKEGGGDGLMPLNRVDSCQRPHAIPVSSPFPRHLRLRQNLLPEVVNLLRSNVAVEVNDQVRSGIRTNGASSRVVPATGVTRLSHRANEIETFKLHHYRWTSQ